MMCSQFGSMCIALGVARAALGRMVVPGGGMVFPVIDPVSDGCCGLNSFSGQNQC